MSSSNNNNNTQEIENGGQSTCVVRYLDIEYWKEHIPIPYNKDWLTEMDKYDLNPFCNDIYDSLAVKSI